MENHHRHDWYADIYLDADICLESDICPDADICGEIDVDEEVDVQCGWWYLVIKSHGKEDSVDTDGSKDEILKEGAGDKCPNLTQIIILTKHFHMQKT